MIKTESIGLTLCNNEFVSNVQECPKRIRRYPKVIKIGEKHPDTVFKIMEGIATKNVPLLKKEFKELLKISAFKFLYHGDILIPFYKNEPQLQAAMIVDVSAKGSLLHHITLTSKPLADTRNVIYIGKSVTKYINKFFLKSVKDFYQKLIEANPDLIISFEIYPPDSMIKNKNLASYLTYIPYFDDIYITTNEGKDIYIKDAVVKDPIPIAPKELNISQIPNIYIEKNKFIFVNQAIPRKHPKIIYLGMSDVMQGIIDYMRIENDPIIHGDIIIPLIDDKHYLPAALLLDMSTNTIRDMYNHTHKALEIANAASRHIFKYFGVNVLEYYKDLLKHLPKDTNIHFTIYRGDPIITDDSVKNIHYEFPEKLVTIEFKNKERKQIQIMEDNTFGIDKIQILQQQEKILQEQNDETVKNKCTIM